MEDEGAGGVKAKVVKNECRSTAIDGMAVLRVARRQDLQYRTRTEVRWREGHVCL